jgi:hypothetical protein
MVTIECCYEFRHVNITFGDPQILFVSITFPSNQILQPLSVHSTIHYFLHLVPLFSSYDFWWWWGFCSLSSDWVWWKWQEFDHVEDWVDV